MHRTRTAAVLTIVFAAGCDPAPRQPTAPPAAADRPAEPRANLPRPDPLQIRFDPSARALTLYDLPVKDARWMLVTAGTPAGSPVPAAHTFMDDPDPDRTAVFYATAAGTSPRVTLREVLDARLAKAD